jgi:protein phosphatase
MILIESAGITDVGKKRKGNEDALFLEDSLGLYVVADGMGGHLAGEVASRLVVDTIGDFIKDNRKNPVDENFLNGDKSLSREAKRLLSGIHLSNQVVHDAARTQPATTVHTVGWVQPFPPCISLMAPLLPRMSVIALFT